MYFHSLVANVLKRVRSLAIAVLATGLIAGAAQAFDSINVVGEGSGRIVLLVTLTDGTVFAVPVDVKNGESATTIASHIAQEINGQKRGTAFPDGASVGLEGTTKLGESTVRDQGSNLAIELDFRFASLNLPVGVLSFEPDLLDGETILASAANISAGFTSGLSPVSFDEPAGTDISTLASLLNSTLIAAGYTSILVDATNVEVFGTGANISSDFIFAAIPLNAGENLGISIDTHAVPEPGTAYLLASFVGLFGLALTCRKRNV
jgi:hypothetical protein